MCLYIKKEDFKVKTATEDIKCYKIVDKVVDGVYCSMYQGFSYRQGSHYKEKFSLSVENPENKFGISRPNGEYEIYRTKAFPQGLYGFDAEIDKVFVFGKNGFHAFKDIEKKDVYGTGFVAIECIIPKGSRYVEGIDLAENKPAYFCEEIRVRDEIKFA